MVGAQGEVAVAEVAARAAGRANRPASWPAFDGRPAVLLAVMKQANANTLDLVERIKGYMAERNALGDSTGVELVLVDDQTIPTATPST